jgi:hypothetical protein
MTLQFKKATKAAAKLRLGLTGPSGSGKTYTALAIGTHLGKKVAVVDTERGSASLYADRFAFDALDLPDLEPETYMEAIRAAGKAGYDVLVVDSFSHAWEKLKDRVDSIAKAKYRGNSWSAWSELTPIQNELIETILQYPGHVIATLRTKTAWETEKDERTGKAKPVKVGLAPIQREGVDYEFTIVLELSEGGLAKVGKTRWSAIADKVFVKPGEDFAKNLLGWLGSSEAVAPATPSAEDPVAKKRAWLMARGAELPPSRVETFLELVQKAKDLAALDYLERSLERALEQEAAKEAARPKTLAAAMNVPASHPLGPDEDTAAAEGASPSSGSSHAAASSPDGAVAGTYGQEHGAPPAAARSSSTTQVRGVAAPGPAPSAEVEPARAAGENTRGAQAAGPAPQAAPVTPPLSPVSKATGAATVAPVAIPSLEGKPFTRSELAAWIGDEATAQVRVLDDLELLLEDPKAGPHQATSTFAEILSRRYGREATERRWQEAGGQIAVGAKRRAFVPMDGVTFSQFVYGSLRSVVHAADSPLAKELARIASELEKASLVSQAIGDGKDF